MALLAVQHIPEWRKREVFEPGYHFDDPKLYSERQFYGLFARVTTPHMIHKSIRV